MVKVLSNISIIEVFLNDCRISGYFDIKFPAVVLLESILQKFENLKVSIFNTKKVYFHVTCVVKIID